MNAESSVTAGKSREEELLELLARQAHRVSAPVFILSAIVAGLVAQYLPIATWLPWLVAVAVILVIRRIVIPRLPGMTDMSLLWRLKIAGALSLINGIIQASSLVFFPFLPDFERAVQTMILIGLCTASVPSTAGQKAVLYPFIVPVFVPLILLWAVAPGSEGIGWANIAVSVPIIIFGITLVRFAADSRRLFNESFEIRLQQVALNERLRSALDEADAANRAKTRFLAAASHDLRQPLHTLSLYGAALAIRPLDDRSREIARHMDSALQVLASQLDALLDISKLDAGVVDVNMSTCNLEEFLELARLEFEPVCLEKGLTLSIACPPDCFVDTDTALMGRIVKNLVSNAIKYTDEGHVDVSVIVEPGVYVLRILDTGAGIPEEEQKHIFEEFYQLSNPHRDRTEGFGLGLSIVKRLAHLLELDMEMTSRVGEGTCFSINLPRAQGESTASKNLSTDVDLKGLQVLAVDDEADIGLGTKMLLEELGCDVSVANSMESAVSAAQAHKPDIVLADFRLRDGDDGLSTVRALRDLYSALPAILISGDTAPDRLRDANRAGIELLHKPVVVEDLKRAIAVACIL